MIFNILLFSIIFVVLAFSRKDMRILWGCLLIFLGLLPIVIYYLVKFIIYQRIKVTDIQEVRLGKQTSSNRKFVGFNVSLMINGKKQKVKIKPIFTRSAGSLCASLYINENLWIGYYEKTNEAIVLGIVEE